MFVDFYLIMSAFDLDRVLSVDNNGLVFGNIFVRKMDHNVVFFKCVLKCLDIYIGYSDLFADS